MNKKIRFLKSLLAGKLVSQITKLTSKTLTNKQNFNKSKYK